MTDRTACPNLLDLQEFLLVLIHGPDQESIQRHLEECDRCVLLANALKEDRHRGVRPAEVPAPAPNTATPLATAVIRPVRKIDESCDFSDRTLPEVKPPSGTRPNPSKPAQQVDVEPVPPASENDPAAEHSQAVIAALAPAQGSDELGRLGPYRILKVLGSGATGVVFEAQDSQLRRTVALKVMKFSADDSDVSRQRFLREARAAAALDHDRVVTIFQVGEDRGLPYLAMQLLQGETLDSRIKREGRLPMREVLRIGREIAEGLAAAYERGLIHRDIKPANIWLEKRPGTANNTARVKIVDFGLARGAVEDQQLTRTGTVLGTPAYMAPEQARAGTVDHRSDLFSLGCVLYRLCTGELPFQADDVMGMLLAVACDQPKPILSLNPEVPEPLIGLVNRLLAKHPEGRPATPSDVVSILNDIEEMRTEHPHVAAKPRTEPSKPARSGTWPQLALVAVMGLLTFAVAWFWSDVRRYVSNEGLVVILADDADLKVTIKRKGMPVLERTSQREIELPVGEYEIELVEGRKVVRLLPTQFTVRRGRRLDVRGVAERSPGGVGEGVRPTIPTGKKMERGKPARDTRKFK